MRRILIVTSIVALGAIGTSVAAGAGTSTLPHAPKDCTEPKVEPHRIVLGCADFSTILKRLQWSAWTADSASGTGKLLVNDCDPDCASGTFDKFPVDVQLIKPKIAPCGEDGELLMFRKAVLGFPGQKPPNANGLKKVKLFCEESGSG